MKRNREHDSRKKSKKKIGFCNRSRRHRVENVQKKHFQTVFLKSLLHDVNIHSILREAKNISKCFKCRTTITQSQVGIRARFSIARARLLNHSSPRERDVSPTHARPLDIYVCAREISTRRKKIPFISKTRTRRARFTLKPY